MFRKILVANRGEIAIGARSRLMPRRTSSGGRGVNAGKKIKARKRHIVVDTIGLKVGLVVRAADIQYRDGATALLSSIRQSCPWLRNIFADGGYQGRTYPARSAGSVDGCLICSPRKASISTFGFSPGELRNAT